MADSERERGAPRPVAAAAQLARIRQRAARHAEELDAVHWFTPEALADRWGLSARTVRKIPREQLAYKEFGTGAARKRRRYPPDAVQTYEAEGTKGAA